MALVNVAVPKDYGYVVLTAVSSLAVGLWHGLRVGGFRKRAGVAYPNAYATQEAIEAAAPTQKQALYLFNCAQRAHANYLENHALALPALLLGGLARPRAAAVAGAVWLVSCIVYAVGYTRADKPEGKGRLAGLFYAPAQLALFGMAGMFGWELLA